MPCPIRQPEPEEGGNPRARTVPAAKHPTTVLRTTPRPRATIPCPRGEQISRGSAIAPTIAGGEAAAPGRSAHIVDAARSVAAVGVGGAGQVEARGRAAGAGTALQRGAAGGVGGAVGARRLPAAAVAGGAHAIRGAQGVAPLALVTADAAAADIAAVVR